MNALRHPMVHRALGHRPRRRLRLRQRRQDRRTRATSRSIVYHYQVIGPSATLGFVPANLLAVSLPWLELIAGVLLVTGVWRREAAVVSAAMLVVFVAAVGSTLVRGIDIENCGCFAVDESGRAAGWKLIAGDLALLAAALVVAFVPTRAEEPAEDAAPVTARLMRVRLFARAGALAGGLAAVLAAAACDQPPVKEIESAEQQVARAGQAGAREWAADRYLEAEDALALARRKMEERDYRGALSSANDAADRARAAIALVEPARQAARESAELAVSEIRSTLDRAAVERAAAVKAGVSRARLAPLDARVEEAKASLADVSARLARSTDLAAARKALEELQIEVVPLPDQYRAIRVPSGGRPRPGAGRPAARSR